MLSSQERVGRILKVLHPEMFEDLAVTHRETLKDPKYVQIIFDSVKENFPIEDEFNCMLLFIASCYQLYEPLSFFFLPGEGVSAKLPAGVRDEMSRCLNFNNPEMVNAYKGYCDSPMKPNNNGVVKPFYKKVMTVVDLFEPFSIHKDSQYKLFA
ncbi:hypothetical protein [Pedobacter punctiformis]|uniref:Uncharacterized protein n=1 Tax=Pedobacter punctiformis TaxID=3004097 RepID=A0ABT4LAI5_9SPHI|nr:hypothetical protein [Pedobacter sp. HCMS5-2]MCZ4244942.1 hypothetical protein [Pedobacter sp. HCMS5-2]